MKTVVIGLALRLGGCAGLESPDPASPYYVALFQNRISPARCRPAASARHDLHGGPDGARQHGPDAPSPLDEIRAAVVGDWMTLIPPQEAL